MLGEREDSDAMAGMRSPPMTTLMCCIPTCHPLTGRKAWFTGSIDASLFLHDLSGRNQGFSPQWHILLFTGGGPSGLRSALLGFSRMPGRDEAWRSWSRWELHRRGSLNPSPSAFLHLPLTLLRAAVYVRLMELDRCFPVIQLVSTTQTFPGH